MTVILTYARIFFTSSHCCSMNSNENIFIFFPASLHSDCDTFNSRMNENKRKKMALIRWFTARLLCSIHLIISIVLLLGTKSLHHLFYIPIIAVGLIILEIIVFSFLKFRYQYAFILLLTYSVFIITTIWLLEIFRINHLIIVANQHASVEVFSVVYYAPIQTSNSFVLNNKYLWSQIQIQAYIFIIVVLKGLCETKDDRLQIIVKTWTAALDIIDFIGLLSYSKLYSDRRFVYVVLSIWSISCIQFIVPVSKIQQTLRERKYYRLAVIITYSLISMLISDVPCLIIRLYAIFGVKNHEYTSYFLLVKNLVVIILQTADVWTSFNPTKKTNTKQMTSI